MPERRTDSRSSSPVRSTSSQAKPHHRRRSCSPWRRHQHQSAHSSPPTRAQTVPLPNGARQLSRHDLIAYTPLFALYLDVQKRIILEDLDEKEARGRWKSFVGKWNRGELTEGWYDPTTLQKAQSSAQSHPIADAKRQRPNNDIPARKAQSDDDISDEDYGPALPTSPPHQTDHESSYTNHAHGATVPSLTDLRSRDEEAAEDETSARRDHTDDLRTTRRLDRKQQKDRLDDLLPRAEPGTRDRQLEKKREKADANRSFAASKDAGGDTELRDADVMGDEDSLGELKRMKHENQRKKNERELRKEEILRARQAERDVRIQAAREKEEKTMSVFREIARQKFGASGSE